MVTYNLDIPDGPNNPSNDQPKMKTNTNAIQTLISVDHVGFNTNGSPPNGVGGHHLQVSFDGKNVPLAQTDPQSVLYTNNGTGSTIADLYFRNQNGIFPVSKFRAYASIGGSTGAFNGSQFFNVSAAATPHPSPGVFEVSINPNIINNYPAESYGVLVSAASVSSNAIIATYQLVSAVLVRFLFFRSNGTIADPDNFTFAIFQL